MEPSEATKEIGQVRVQSAAADLSADEIQWFVAHVRPRCEKKLVEFCQREELSATLPTYESVKKYRGKKVVFHKPLFPGYVFLYMARRFRQKVYQSDYVANLLDVADQETFQTQLDNILTALDSQVEIRVSPEIQAGRKVIIRSGPMRGIEGVVQRRAGMVEVHLQLDFIGQAAVVRAEAMDLDLVD